MHDTPTVDLLRHGATQNSDIYRGVTDDPLSDAGREQMFDALAIDEDRQWDHIITSPLSRCRHFAEELAIKLNLDLSIDKRVQEYNFGQWDGETFDSVYQHSADKVALFFEDPFKNPPPDAEDYSEFNARVHAFWNEIRRSSAHRRTLVITHGGVILSILANVFGVKRLRSCVELHYACRTRIRLDNAGESPRMLFHQ